MKIEKNSVKKQYLLSLIMTNSVPSVATSHILSNIEAKKMGYTYSTFLVLIDFTFMRFYPFMLAL